MATTTQNNVIAVNTEWRLASTTNTAITALEGNVAVLYDSALPSPTITPYDKATAFLYSKNDTRLSNSIVNTEGNNTYVRALNEFKEALVGVTEF